MDSYNSIVIKKRTELKMGERSELASELTRVICQWQICTREDVQQHWTQKLKLMKQHYDTPTRLAKIKEDATYQGLARVSGN